MDLKRRIGILVAGSTIAVAGLTSAGTAWAETNVTASSDCEDCESESGNATSQNSSATFVGQNAGPGGTNVQEGDNEADVEQDAKAESGDAASGQVIGVVDGGGGDVNVNASSTCKDCKATTGDAHASNVAITFVGLNSFGGLNIQNGDNEADVEQATYSQSGDGVTGQIVGVVTA